MEKECYEEEVQHYRKADYNPIIIIDHVTTTDTRIYMYVLYKSICYKNISILILYIHNIHSYIHVSIYIFYSYLLIRR